MNKFIQWLLAWLGMARVPQHDERKGNTMCNHYNANDLLERVQALLVEMEWKFAQNPDVPDLLMLGGGKHGCYGCLLQIHPERPLVIFYAHVQCRVPEEKRGAMAEFLTRANYGLWLGNFEMDCHDGEIRYKTSLHIGDGVLTRDMLSNVLWANLGTVDRYLHGIMSVLWNDVSPEDAAGMVQGS